MTSTSNSKLTPYEIGAHSVGAYFDHKYHPSKDEFSQIFCLNFIQFDTFLSTLNAFSNFAAKIYHSCERCSELLADKVIISCIIFYRNEYSSNLKLTMNTQ